MQLCGSLLRFPYMRHFLITTSLFLASAFFCQTATASSPEYIALADSADNYIRRERWEEAERTIISALRLEPANFSNSLLFSNLGVVQTHLGRFDDALESFRLGLSIAPKSSTLHANRARTRIYVKDYSGALSDLDASLAADSIQEWPLQMRGLLRLNSGDLDGASRDFSLLAANYPGNDVAMSGLGRVAVKQGKHDEALRYFNEALSLSDDPETRSERILLLIEMEHFADASADIRKSIEKYPEHPYFYLWRGYLHRLNYRREEAAADKKIALDKGADPQIVEHFLP